MTKGEVISYERGIAGKKADMGQMGEEIGQL